MLVPNLPSYLSENRPSLKHKDREQIGNDEIGRKKTNIKEYKRRTKGFMSKFEIVLCFKIRFTVLFIN